MYQPPRVYHLLTDTGHCAKFTINYNGDKSAFEDEVKAMLGEYNFIGNVVGGSPIYEKSLYKENNIYKEFRKTFYENTWRGAVILFTLLYISFTLIFTPEGYCTFPYDA